MSLVGITYFKTFLSTNVSSLHVVLLPQRLGDWYHVYIKYTPLKVLGADDEYPSQSSNDYNFTLPSSPAIRNDPSYARDELAHTAFIRANETKGNGTYYIGVKLGCKIAQFLRVFFSFAYCKV